MFPTKISFGPVVRLRESRSHNGRAEYSRTKNSRSTSCRCHPTIQKKNIVGAIAEERKAVSADPNFQKAQDQLRYTLQEKEEIEEEVERMRANIKALTQDLTTNENLQERNKLALFCYMVGQNGEAGTEWEWIVRHGNGHAQKNARKRLRQHLQIMPLIIGILAGGQSRRMGMDKAALEFGGTTLLERTARMALAVGLPVLVVGRARPDKWPLPAVTFLEDAEADLGPAGGLVTALHHTQASVLALACDLPLLTEDALRWLIAVALPQPAPSGLMTVNNGGWEPLFSVYHPECLPLLEERIAAGQRSLRKVVAAGAFAFADAPEWVAEQLVNVNTPEEWGTVNAQKRV